VSVLKEKELMIAKISWYGEVMIVSLEGNLSFETVSEFQKKAARHFSQNKVIFSLKNLDFVGSTGVKDFVDFMMELSNKNPFGLGVAEAKSEFEILLAPHTGHSLVLFKTLDMAKRFFSLGHLEFEESLDEITPSNPSNIKIIK
jgi:anti-anti-sigma regulatory factor